MEVVRKTVLFGFNYVTLDGTEESVNVPVMLYGLQVQL